MKDPFDLQRFVTAQDPLLADVLEELRRGQKASHWMWFIFPQLRGLGGSWAADHFGIASRAEADAYLRHPVLGQRLLGCTALVNQIEGSSIQKIFGGIDSIKFRSSMTLFDQVDADKRVFAAALHKYFDGEVDRLTLDMLERGQNAAGE
jgi:uncharacterized protein (DUF1810 family)